MNITLLNIQEIHIKHDKKTGLIAVVALDKPEKNPGLGGCRCVSYASLDDAIADAARLARTMSKKTKFSNVPFSGGKAVLMRPAADFDRAAYFKSFGRFIESLDGRFITGCDSGVSEEDIKQAATETGYLTGFKPAASQRDELSYLTALGVTRAMKAAVEVTYQKNSLQGLHIVIQGVGKVGYYLAQILHEAGCQLTVCDINPDTAQKCAQQFQAAVIDCADIYNIACDVFSPCGLGNVITPETVPLLKTRIVCGAANNPLSEDAMADALFTRKIAYIPDFIANVGGTMYAAGYYQRMSVADIEQKVTHEIYNTVLNLCQNSIEKNIPVLTLAHERFAESE